MIVVTVMAGTMTAVVLTVMAAAGVVVDVADVGFPVLMKLICDLSFAVGH